MTDRSVTPPSRPASGSEGYVLGVDEGELRRLGLQHRLWAREAHDIWRRAGLRPASTVLDVGCGPGFAALDLAHLVGPSGSVIAIDESPGFIEHLGALASSQGLTTIDPRVSDAQHLDLPSESVDFVYIRWVLCFVPNPEAVVEAFARCLRKGGVVAIQDYCNYLAVRLSPRSPAFERAVKATNQSWRDRGGDPDIGIRLPTMLANAGLRVEEIAPLTRVARPGQLLWQWPDSFFANFIPRLLSLGLLSDEEAAAFHAEWTERSSNPNAFLSTPPMLDIIARKA